MVPKFSASVSDFLAAYRRDAPLRWSPDDHVARQAFVNLHLAGAGWLDWSSEAATLELLQASWMAAPLASAGEYETIFVAGPVTELLEPAQLFQQAANHLKPGGRLVGILPCLRDNSPESQQFRDLAAARLWPYYTVEDLTELAEEAGLEPDRSASGFVPIPRFKEAVLEGRLVFQGFRQIFERLQAQGYDPREIGWGELRLVAILNQNPSSS